MKYKNNYIKKIIFKNFYTIKHFKIIKNAKKNLKKYISYT